MNRSGASSRIRLVNDSGCSMVAAIKIGYTVISSA